MFSDTSRCHGEADATTDCLTNDEVTLPVAALGSGLDMLGPFVDGDAILDGISRKSRPARAAAFVTEVKSEQIEDILAKFSEMGVNVVDTKEAELDEEVATGEEASIEEERRVQVLVRDSRYLKLCQPMGTMAANWKKRRLRYVFWAALRTSHACLYTQQWACRR
jgi:hypothetical protein